MEEKDFRRIEEMMSRMMGQFRGEIGEDLRQQLGVQREDFQHKLDLVVEGQQSLGERMDRFEGRMTGIENRLERVEVRGVAVEMKVDALEKKVDALDEKVDAVVKKVDAVAVDVAAHRRDTEAHRKGWRVSDGE